MLGLSEQQIGCLHKCTCLSLQVPATALLDFGCALDQPGKEASTFSRTLAAVPKQMLAVTTSRIQSQMASTEPTDYSRNRR